MVAVAKREAGRRSLRNVTFARCAADALPFLGRSRIIGSWNASSASTGRHCSRSGVLSAEARA